LRAVRSDLLPYATTRSLLLTCSLAPGDARLLRRDSKHQSTRKPPAQALLYTNPSRTPLRTLARQKSPNFERVSVCPFSPSRLDAHTKPRVRSPRPPLFLAHLHQLTTRTAIMSTIQHTTNTHQSTNNPHPNTIYTPNHPPNQPTTTKPTNYTQPPPKPSSHHHHNAHIHYNPTPTNYYHHHHVPATPTPSYTTTTPSTSYSTIT